MVGFLTAPLEGGRSVPSEGVFSRLRQAARDGDPVDDLSLIRATLRGSREHFGVLVERYQRPLFAFVVRYLGDVGAAEDVVQVSFLRAYKALRTFRGDAAFKTWLHQIALNECRSRQLREQRRREVAIDDVAEAVLPAVDSGNDLATDRRGLRRFVDRLPPKQRAVVELRVYADLPFKEIARMEGMSVGSAKVNFHHALKKLREWMT